MKVSIIVPAHNEENNLAPLMEKLVELKATLGDMEIIFVDDNSTDSTPQLCDGLARKYGFVRVLHRKGGPKGMGYTLQEGTAAAKGGIIVWTMADLSDDLAIVPKFVKKIEGGADMVFGSRYMKGGNSGDLSGVKRFASWGVSFVSEVFIGVKVHDITNAYRAFRKEVFYEVRPQYGDFGISPEFALKAHLAGYKLDEVPTTYAMRKTGVAQFRMFKMAVRYFSIFLTAFLLRTGIRKGW
jgi:glycosyltransferase involved in cell wall biosynthesis